MTHRPMTAPDDPAPPSVALEAVGVRYGDRVALQPVGLSVAACLKYFGASRVMVVESNPRRLEVARQMGFTTIDLANENVAAQVVSR